MEEPKKRGRAGKVKVADEEPTTKKAKKPDENAAANGAKTAPAGGATDDFSSEATCEDGRRWNFKVASWNVNGLRAWIEKGGLDYLRKENPDVFFLQETKCSKDKLPAGGERCGRLHGALAGGRQGRLLRCRDVHEDCTLSIKHGIGMSEHDKEGRAITAEYDKFFVVGVYVPNSQKKLARLDYRQKWDKDFRDYLKKLENSKPVILCGDLNVCHEEIDLARPANNHRNAGFSDEEREGFTQLLNAGFIDTYRSLHPAQAGAYTFWTYMMNARSKDIGWRLDYFVISESLLPDLCDSVIRKHTMGSDHCPIALLLAV
ncbi:PREDICTED: DNA-(apurinic or apyrimidinic site) lyase-like [Priapulus caudatus]|uniref:exodeoxyribonuclease III n=1 Tax=Priapulus caudatus TaxID=37621 RepID=A0ABM1EKC1_PRICU|nr:PREDICTED: DNA-(apurinic or apyrimidinic site) lyase-like [Priapulus caudatus]